MYNLAHQAFRKGWLVIKAVQIPGDGVQAPGSVVMCEIPGSHPYVIHFFNAQDGGFHSGDYCKTRAEAEEAYAKRILHFLDRGEPWDTDGDTSKWNENGEGTEADNDRNAPRH